MITRQQFEQLAGNETRPCVTMYSPTHDAGAEAKGDPIRLKNLLQDAERQLGELGVPKSEAGRLVAPGWDTHSELSPAMYGSGTLAIYCAADLTVIEHIRLQLDELVLVGERFHLKPIIPIVSGRARFYVLAVSQKKVRLLDCTRFVARDVELANVPRSLEDALGKAKPDEGVQYHTTPAARSGNGRAMYHGHGAGQDDRQGELFRYFRLVSQGIAPRLDGRSPLVFAGVEHLFPIYRQANTYANLLDKAITGSPDNAKPAELRDRGWAIVEPIQQEVRMATAERFPELAAHGRATDDIVGVALSARNGLVEVMLGASDQFRWGRVSDTEDKVQQRAERLPGDYDLVDYAAVRTLMQGGTSYIVPAEEVPGEGPAAALLRY